MTSHVGSRFGLDSEIRQEAREMLSFQFSKMSCQGHVLGQEV